eukprot:6226577-Ditylum_brightwellii.AAC.1
MLRWTQLAMSRRGSGRPLAMKACATKSTASCALFPDICVHKGLKVPAWHACMKVQRMMRQWEGGRCMRKGLLSPMSLQNASHLD